MDISCYTTGYFALKIQFKQLMRDHTRGASIGGSESSPTLDDFSIRAIYLQFGRIIWEQSLNGRVWAMETFTSAVLEESHESAGFWSSAVWSKITTCAMAVPRLGLFVIYDGFKGTWDRLYTIWDGIFGIVGAWCDRRGHKGTGTPVTT